MGSNLRAKRRKLYIRQNGVCFHCCERVSWDASTVDHLVPLALGGSSHGNNLAMSCYRCNQLRGAKLSGMLNAARKDPNIRLATFVKAGHVKEDHLNNDPPRASDDWFRRKSYDRSLQITTLRHAFERAGLGWAALSAWRDRMTHLRRCGAEGSTDRAIQCRPPVP